jgi:hypothetical protein
MLIRRTALTLSIPAAVVVTLLLLLPFFTVWRARNPSPLKVACTLAVATGTAAVETEG